jgi:hypothetical protein
VALTVTTIAAAAAGALLPFTPLGPPLGFVVPPLRFGAFVAAATLVYLGLVQVAKSALGRNSTLTVEKAPGSR